ncbi:MAG: hypothetical protein ACOYOE_01240 [Chlorobium sp.]
MHTLEWLGNCVAASILSTRYQAVRDKKLLLVVIGAGLSIGGIVMTVLSAKAGLDEDAA